MGKQAKEISEYCSCKHLSSNTQSLAGLFQNFTVNRNHIGVFTYRYLFGVVIWDWQRCDVKGSKLRFIPLRSLAIVISKTQVLFFLCHFKATPSFFIQSFCFIGCTNILKQYLHRSTIKDDVMKVYE